MVKNDIRPYEMSLWTLQDSFITVLKPFGFSSRGQIETPKCRIKNDGTQELSFSIPMYYRKNGELIENPIWYNVINGSLIVNLRKLKLIFNKGDIGEEVVEFVINNVVETHTDGQLRCEVTAEGLAFQELGKVGYKISLLSQDFIDEYNEWAESDRSTKEPKNNINYWCEKIFKNSRWTYSIQMDWSGFDGIIVDDISGSYTIPDEEGNETEIIYNGAYQNAPKEIQNAFNKIREETLRRLDRIYEEEYISSWEYIKPEAERNEALIPAHMEPYKEKLRLVDLEKSNIYNLTQDLAKAFGVYCKYKYHYDTNYHIIGKECIFYNNFLSEKEGKIDIIYPYSASKIEREIDSADVVTKMFVTPIEDDTSPSGLITIADVTANKTREDYILNFDYLYKIGTISQEQYNAIEDYQRSMFLFNTELEPLAMQIANLETDLVTYKAQLTLAKESKILDKEQMEQSTALLNSIISGTNRLYKNLDNPHKGNLSRSDTEEELYEIKLTVEGIYTNTEFIEGINTGYPLREGEENTYGIRLWYRTSTENIDSYEEEKSFTINRDTNGNVISLSKIKKSENSISNFYYVTFAYLPQLYYQNIYDTYARKFAEDEALEKEAEAKIKEIEDKLIKIEEKYNSLLEEKSLLIADFENMMGPALKEGSWQAENYSDYGSKYSGNVYVEETEEQKNTVEHIVFNWDTVPFDEEQSLYYETFGEEGNSLVQKYYPCIDISSILNEIKDNLNDLSFIYYETISGTDTKDETQTYSKTKQMTIGSEMEYAFIKVKEEEKETIKPVLLLLDKKFELTDEAKKGFLGIITSTVSEEGVSIQEKKIVGDLTWIENNKDSVIVYPRLKVDSLLLKTSEDELIIKLILKTDDEKDLEKVLKNYYDYSVLIRGESYLITLKNKIMLQNGSLNKTFNMAYALSNAALSLYLDALEVSKTNAFPQVSYTLEVSAMNENFIKYAYQNLNRIVSINDSELKFDDVQGYISELELDLENPWEDSIVIQNYKTKFEDLFSTIVASTEQMKTNAFAYNNAASAFTSGGTLKPSIIQNTINQTDLTYAFQSGNLTIDEINGIWARSDAGVVAMRGGGIFCATETDGNGNWLWNTGIMPSGINASLLTAGQIDTNLIKIYAGDNLRLQLNADGLFAYNKDILGEANLKQYVVHNSDGLFLVQPQKNLEEEELDNLINKVEISWNGLILRNDLGDRVFYANDNGDLTISGIITAKEGNIGKWQIVEHGLQTEDGFAGIFAKRLYDDEGNIIDSTKGDNMIWVTGLPDEPNGGNHEFRVTNLGELYCSSANIKGTVAAGSFVGNTEVGEVDSQLRTIRAAILDGTSFTFTNYNYDGILRVEPEKLKFRIYTNALTKEELTPLENDPEDYIFSYGIGDSVDSITQWHQITLNENSANIMVDGNNKEFFFWEPNYLTFHAKNAIMYLGKDNPSSINLNSVLYLKVEKYGKQRIIENGKPVYKGNTYTDEEGNEQEKSFIYSDTIQLVAETFGLGKYVSPIDPPSYTFVEDKNLEIQYKDEISFSTTLTGFDFEKDLEELENSTWLINGEDYNLRAKLVSTLLLETESTAEDAAILISDKEEIIINGEQVEEPVTDENGVLVYTKIDGNTSDSKNGISISLVKQEDGSIRAIAVVSKESVPDGGNIKLTFKIGQATRDCFCFKTRNGSDGVNIILRSSSGSTLTSGDAETELSTEVYYGSQLMNGEDSEIQFYYVWKKDNEALSSISKLVVSEVVNPDTTEITMVDELEKIEVKNEETNEANINFFIQPKIYITAEDFGLKSDYRCDVFTSLKEAVDEYLLLNKNRDEELIIPESEKKE